MLINEESNMEDHLKRAIIFEKSRMKQNGLSTEYDPVKNCYGSLQEMIYRFEHVANISIQDKAGLVQSISNKISEYCSSSNLNEIRKLDGADRDDALSKHYVSQFHGIDQLDVRVK